MELCRLIARLDLPLSIADNDAWDEYSVLIILDMLEFLDLQLLETCRNFIMKN
jgi:hypothetical protein